MYSPKPASSDTLCCRFEELTGTTLVEKLLKIQQYATPNDKSLDWAMNLRCLSHRFGTNIFDLKKKPNRGGDFNDYIAVSYSWENTLAVENEKHGGYIIKSRNRLNRRSIVRDRVLFRTLRYAEHVNIRRIWIDQECFAQ